MDTLIQQTLIEPARRAGNLAETHASWVLLGESLVYKIKKAVDFGFLDFSTRDKRRAACEAELRLNARLAEDVYLGLVPLRRGTGGVYVDDGEGEFGARWRAPEDEVVDWAVKMRRLRDADRADELLRRGRLTPSQVRALAQLLVRFHAASKTSEHIRSFGRVDAILDNVRENFRQTRAVVSRYVDAETERRIEAQQLGFIDEHRALLDRRARSGAVRDGHGDLRLEHVYFEPSGIKVIDCIEFNERFRYADVAADLAFLVMDLRHEGQPLLAEVLLAEYASGSADFEIYRLIDFYESYRAYVRAKVAAFVDAQAPDPEVSARARRYFLHALAAGSPPRERPRLVVVAGLIAAGKTTLCGKLSTRHGWPVLDTDRCRKALVGLDPWQTSPEKPFEGLYSEEMSEKVYAAISERAEWVLESGRSVLVEGSFRLFQQRQSMRDLARRVGVELTFLWCEVPRDVAIERLGKRARERTVSDGRVEIYDDLARTFEPFGPEEHGAVRAIDTTAEEQELDAQLSRVAL